MTRAISRRASDKSHPKFDDLEVDGRELSPLLSVASSATGSFTSLMARSVACSVAMTLLSATICSAQGDTAKALTLKQSSELSSASHNAMPSAGTAPLPGAARAGDGGNGAVSGSGKIQYGAAETTHYQPAARTIAYLPPQKRFVPETIISSLTQAAMAQSANQSAKQNATQKAPSGMLHTSSAVPRFFVNRVVYRPSAEAAKSFLHDQALSQDTATYGERHGQLLHGEPQAKRSSSALGARDEYDMNQTLKRELEKNELSLKVSAAMIQVVQALGLEPGVKRETLLAGAREQLDRLCGEGQSRWCVERLQKWGEEARGRYDEYDFSKQAMSSIQEMEAADELTRDAIRNDREISNIRATLGLSDVGPSGISRTLSTVGIVPFYFTAVANMAQSGVESGSGGGRVKRLAEVMNQGQILTSRVNLLTREAGLVTNQNNLARQTDNKLLFAFTSDFAGHLRGR